MIPYLELSVAGHAIFAFCTMLLTLGAVFLFVGIGMMKMGRQYLFYSTFLTAVTLFVFQGITDASNYVQGGIKELSFFGKLIGFLPYAAIALLFVLIALAEGFLFTVLLYRRKNRLTQGVFKESLDSLPDGVCFYSADGQPLLVNRQMQCISGELFDSEILNVNRFQNRLLEAAAENRIKTIRTEPTVIVRTKDGKVWDFHCSERNTEKPGLHELIAFDITEQYRLSIELKQRNERLNRINERLQRFSEKMVTFTAEKELLNAKIDVHDNIGRSLLACQAYFQQNREERSRKDLLLLWRYVFSVMKNEALPSGEWELLQKTADMLGITIELTGTMPENLRIRTAIVTAIRECLTNTANHAGGDKLFVKVWEEEQTVTAELTNTGKPPECEIRETGGLKNLRRVAQRAGGTMMIESNPRFLLRLAFEKGESGEWQKQEYWS